MDKNNAILYQVAFKGAIDIVAAGEVETDDVLGEVFALTDAFFEGLTTKIGKVEEGGSGNGKRTFTKKPSGGFKKQGSTQGGNTRQPFTGTIKNPDDPATEPQLRKLASLGYDGDTDGLTKGEASDLIQQAMG